MAQQSKHDFLTGGHRKESDEDDEVYEEDNFEEKTEGDGGEDEIERLRKAMAKEKDKATRYN
jgi:hypothetical protein